VLLLGSGLDLVFK